MAAEERPAAVSWTTQVRHDGCVGDDRFADRLRSGRYENDPLVGVFGYDHSTPAEASVPERVWRRLHALGVAYELHYLTLCVGETEPLIFNPPQASGLLDELGFVAKLVNDPLLMKHLDAITTVVAASARGGQNPALRIEGQ